ncbi:LamG domain-containing protein [Luteolibacter flavescens]|uniref:LamG domain-containing protein n=1 Tax=Luteolibacter flavescens TaxID=1859460 RepID=A0ABT3FN72_9BACT|nr:LamG domain-containing protein [Luteolibacter flavescens]MCW1885013.1 LamG domain-containing protein [Luteolibacter flavescens]
MYLSHPRRSLRLAILAAGLGSSFSLAEAAILVGLDPATALYDSDVKGIVNDGGTAGSQSGIPALNDPEHVKGLTFNIAFTPAAADLDRAVPADARTVLLIEIGGTSNGFGLYLIDGVPTVLSKQSSTDATLPASLNDTSLPAIAVQSPIGKLTAGTAYSFSASWNHQGTLELSVQPDGGTSVFSSHTISGTPGNWSGNDTISVKTLSAANAGGLSGNSAGNNFGPPFDVHNAFSFTGTVSRALFWNASSVTPPVATVPAVLGFEATSLPSSGRVRFHWRVTEGGAAAATNIVIRAGDTVVHTPSTLENFADVNVNGATTFTLSATNATGTTTDTVTVAADTAFGTAVRADSPVAWFRFNDQAGSLLIADSAENAAPHNGRVFGQPVTGSTGFVDGAAHFDGGSGIISNTILDPANVTAGFTVEAVIRREPGIIGPNPVVLAQRGTYGRLLLTSPADGKLISDIGGGEAKHSDGKVHDNQWAHVAVVVDRIHTEVRWYIDGELAGSSKDGLNPDGTTFNPNFSVESSTGEWIIGIGKALTGNYWKGHIDELAVYDRLLDDPNADADFSDSRIAAHRNAWWSETTGLLDFSASKTLINAGDPVQFIAKVGADITSVTIDNGVGTVPIVNGNAVITANPPATATYQVTATGPSGSTTSTIAITARQYQAPIVKGFEVTKLGTPGQVRVHWKVAEGEAPNPTTLTIKAGATELHASSSLQGYADVEAGAATQFTLSAVNATGTTNAETALDAETAFSTAVRQAGPVAWYRFNEPAGSEIFVDSADNGAPHNGRPTGTVVSGTAGSVDGAITLNAAGGVITTFNLNPGQLDPGFTIESVVRRDAAISTLNRAVVSQSDLNGTGRVLLGIAEDSGLPRTFLGQGERKDGDTGLAAEAWAHFVVVVDALHTEIRWYIDGELAGSTKDGLNPDGTTFNPNFLLEATSGAWNIGIHKSLTADQWRGEIDEVVIYDTLLDDPDADGDTTDSRIAAHRAAWWSGTSGVIQLDTAATTVAPGGSTDLTIKVGPDITSVSIDHGIGNVPLVNGNAVVTLTPPATTTYTITFTGPGGTFTRTITVTVGETPAVAPVVVSSAIQGGNFVIHFTGAPSTAYAVRGSATLSAFDEDLGTVTTDALGAGTATIPVTPATTPARFFRIQDLP